MDARWHYLALVAECSKSERYECRIPLRLADRASDVADPGAATDALVEAGFVIIEGPDLVIVHGEDRHMPPEGLRDRKRKQGQRERTRRHRQRKCDSGDHDGDCPKSCPIKSGNDVRNGVRNALRNAPSNAPRNAPGNGDEADPPADVDVSTGEIREGNGVRNALRQDRTGQDRTALRGEVVGSSPDIAEFLPPKVSGDDL